jgi:ribulose-5-phosphate 4-epimerase/fuculose-1-phosphate aldolase
MTATQTAGPTQMKAMVVEKPIAPPLPELTAPQQLALLARTLWDEGHNDHLAGHITYKQQDGTFLVNPFGLTWGEVRATDVMRMDADGNELEGKWTITPAIQLHVELHRARDDVTVALHNHTRWGTIWADIGRAPAIYDQSSAYYHGDVALYDEYWGAVDDAANARAAVEAVGSAGVALLANHGVLIMGNSIEQAYLRATSFEWRSRQAWHVEAAGGGKPMNPEAAAAYGSFFNDHNFTGLFEAMCRAQLRRDPSVLE